MLRGERERGASSDKGHRLKGAVLVTNLRRQIKGLSTGRPLRLEGVRLHFGVYIHHRALVVKCSCIHHDAVLETELMMRAFCCDLYSFIFETTKYLPEVHLDPSVHMTMPMKVEEYP